MPPRGPTLVPEAGRYSSPLIELLAQTLAFGYQSTLFFPDRERADARNAPFLNFTICQPVEEPLTEPREVCFGYGVEGVQAELLDPSGSRLAEAWATPYYFGGPSTSGPDPCRTPSLSPPNCREPRAFGTGKTSAGYFYNVPPGNYRIRLFKPGQSLSCSLAPAWLGQLTEEANVFSAFAEAGWNTVGVRAFCK